MKYAETYWNDTTFTPYYRVDPGNHPDDPLNNQKNDCANFVSQAINAGLTNTPPPTAPTANVMGPAGTYPPGNWNWGNQWYYKFKSYNGTNNALGYSGSYAWITVDGQYRFIATTNWLKGPHGGEISICSLKVGDVVQLRDVHDFGVWDHEGYSG